MSIHVRLGFARRNKGSTHQPMYVGKIIPDQPVPNVRGYRLRNALCRASIVPRSRTPTTAIAIALGGLGRQPGTRPILGHGDQCGLQSVFPRDRAVVARLPIRSRGTPAPLWSNSFCARQSPAPVAYRMLRAVRLVLQKCAANLVVGRVCVQGKCSFCTRQRYNRRVKQLLA
jgi:hypothetical protein